MLRTAFTAGSADPRPQAPGQAQGQARGQARGQAQGRAPEPVPAPRHGQVPSQAQAAHASLAASGTEPDRRLSVAPMMDRTDRHCRYFLRLLAPRTLLYTEMITAAALRHGDRRALLEFAPEEHPVALQLGGAEPEALAQAAVMGAAAGYDEINLNVGCPSDRVQAGRFGAALMREPGLVAACVSAMREAVEVPVTVKTRLGVDYDDSYDFVCEFVGRVAEAGCRTFVVHARKAWLKGLSPKQNREVPPLDYGRVRRLKQDFPALEIVLNGGLTEAGPALTELAHVDGVMLGRAAYQDPYLLARLDEAVFGGPPRPSRREALEVFVPYLERAAARGTPVKSMTRHLLGLFAGLPGGRRWRRALGALPAEPAAAIAALLAAAPEKRGQSPFSQGAFARGDGCSTRALEGRARSALGSGTWGAHASSPARTETHVRPTWVVSEKGL